MKILFISTLASLRLVDEIHNITGGNPGYAVQKFCRLIVKGLNANGIETRSLSNPPITRKENSKYWVKLGREEENGLTYIYVPFINLPVLKHICVFLFTFFFVLVWGVRERRDKAIICDVLSISNCLGALLASKLNRLRSVALVTDIYSQMVGEETIGFRAMVCKTAGAMQKWYSTSFTHYVLLTEAMNEIVNPRKRPYIVMEALCDSAIQFEHEFSIEKDLPATVLYAGGVEQQYGLKTLVEAFQSIKRDDVRLIIYGHGSYVEDIKRVSNEDKRIEYRGIVPNEVIIDAERKATLLVNPRFTNEVYTKYSFPSKNMEYMVSGTPVLTTILPGMPQEYYPYVFLFDKGETVEGYSEVLRSVLSLSPEILTKRGKMAREFVLKKKNNLVQTNRIVELITVER